MVLACFGSTSKISCITGPLVWCKKGAERRPFYLAIRIQALSPGAKQGRLFSRERCAQRREMLFIVAPALGRAGVERLSHLIET